MRSSHQQLVRTARAAEIYYSKAVVLCMIRGEGRRCICKQLAKTPQSPIPEQVQAWLESGFSSMFPVLFFPPLEYSSMHWVLECMHEPILFLKRQVPGETVAL